MVSDWTDPREWSFRDAYLDWTRHLENRRAPLAPADPDPGTALEPVFVRLVQSEAGSRQRLLDLVSDPASPLFMDPHEEAGLRDRIADGSTAGLPDEYALYRRWRTPDSAHADLFEVLDAGMAVCGTQAPSGGPPALPAAERLPAGTPIVAMIDDGIGFLNARFCKAGPDGLCTRFRALWLQSLERFSTDTKQITCGQVLDAAAIDAMLDSRDEQGAYATLNAQLYGPRSRRETGHQTTHGTHVLDLAAGADPLDASDPVRGWPLLAVQLPPEAIDDTSGIWFENYMVQGLRWILRQAHRLAPEAPVVVNLSLGVTAGPKDGSRFVEHQMAREAAEWERVKGQPVRLVWAFGNNYRGSQVAHYTFPRDACMEDREQHIGWRAQPDDETANYLEIRTRYASSSEVTVSLCSPDGADSGFGPLAPGQVRTLEKNGKALARLYHVPKRSFGGGVVSPAHYVLALAPTRGRKATEPVAQAGRWTVGLRYGGTAAAQAVVQIQRDDAMRGGRIKGRQSYLDSDTAGAWDAEDMAYVGFAEGGPVRPEGTHCADATAPARQIFSCGAARVSGRAATRRSAENFRPSRYTAMGASWSIPGPTAATVADTGPFQPGIRAAGTLSGTVRTLNGTSAAAGRLSRALGLSSARIVENAGTTGTTQLDDIAEDAVPRVSTKPADHARLGKAIILPGKR